MCGNGVVEAGETCDPPGGSACDETCQISACSSDEPGALVACHQGTPDLALAGIDEVFLAAFSGRLSGTTFAAEIRRFDAASQLLDAAAIPISMDPADPPNTSFKVSSATAGGASFHVAMTGGASFSGGGFRSVLRKREVPKIGSALIAPVEIASNVPFGACTSYLAGPIGIAAGLSGGEARTTYRRLFGCDGGVLFETITGVSGGFSAPPPGNTSVGSAPLARGSRDLAGVWWNQFIPDLTPPLLFAQSLRVSWLEPGPATLVDLISVHPDLPHSESPALAASGDVFLAVFALAPNFSDRELTTLRGLRFSREEGLLDPPNGLLLASGGGVLDQIVVDGDAKGFLIAYTEELVGGERRVLTMRVGVDGSFGLPAVVDTAIPVTIGQGAPIDIDVVSTGSGSFLGYTSVNDAGYVSVRIIRLDP